MQRKISYSCIILLFITSCTSDIQKYMYAVSPNESNTKSNNKECFESSNYYPDEYTAIRYIPLIFHVIRDDNGNNNFNTTEGTEYIHSLLQIVNEQLANNQKMWLPKNNNTPVLPTQYRYVLFHNNEHPKVKAIQFHNDSDLYYFNKKGGKNNHFDRAQYDKYGVMKDSAINIFLLEHHPDSVLSKTYKASSDGVCPGGWAKMVNAYRETRDSVFDETTQQYKKKTGAEFKRGLFMHELGHGLGLQHTWNSNDGCDDTPYHPNCWHFDSKPGCDSLTSNNMMDYNSWQNAISPCQLGKIHYNLQNTSYIRKYLVNTWCMPQQMNDVIIKKRKQVTWLCNKDVEGNIVIEEKATLTLKCKTSLPLNAKIIVKPGAALILDGALLYNDCNLKWQGIEIWKNEQAEGKVILINNAQIKNNTF